MRATLSQREMAVLDQALRIAREKFHEHHAEMKKQGQDRLADQFLAQAADCSDMLEKLETVADGEGVVLGACDHFQSDGRGCCRNCGHFHGKDEG